MNRYARQRAVIGAAAQDRLRRAHAVVIGAGGLGCPVISLLAGAGLGKLDIIDPDRIEETNLHRQTLYAMPDLGAFKAEVATRQASLANPECEARGHVTRLDPANVAERVRGADVVIDAADSFAVSYALSDHCRGTGQPLISASVIGMSGYVGGFCGGGAEAAGPGLRAVFPDPPASAATCASAGVTGPAVATLGAMQAQMALAVMAGLDPSPIGRLVTLDLQSWRFGGFSFAGAKDIPGPAFIAPSQIDAGDCVIDLRDTALPENLPDTRIVLACTTGLRAWRAAQTLADRGISNIVLLAA